MSETTTIDLSQLPAPAIVEPLEYQTILAEMLVDLQGRDPTFSALVESDPAYKILEVAAYRELLMRQRVNEAAQACMLATAQGTDLDNLAAWWGVERLVLVPADDNSVPPKPAIRETDTAFRARVQLSLARFTTAGATGAYRYYGLSADGDVRDISVASPEYHIESGAIVFDDDAALPEPKPNHVAVTVLSRVGSGIPSQALLDSVYAALNHEQRRPLTDLLVVRPAQLVRYQIEATIVFYEGVSKAAVMQQIVADLHAFVSERHKLGGRVAVSGLYDALHYAGVRYVAMSTPVADVVAEIYQAPYCDKITLNGTDFSIAVQNDSGHTHNGLFVHDGQINYF